METKVAELRRKLSAFLVRVRRGATRWVLKGRAPVARMVPVERDGGLSIREPQEPLASLRRRSAVVLQSRVDAVAVLRADRDHR